MKTLRCYIKKTGPRDSLLKAWYSRSLWEVIFHLSETNLVILIHQILQLHKRTANTILISTSIFLYAIYHKTERFMYMISYSRECLTKKTERLRWRNTFVIPRDYQWMLHCIGCNILSWLNKLKQAKVIVVTFSIITHKYFARGI